jgi:hypothetical protein
MPIAYHSASSRLPFTINNDFGHADAGHPSSHLAEFDTIGMTWKTSSAAAAHHRRRFRLGKDGRVPVDAERQCRLRSDDPAADGHDERRQQLRQRVHDLRQSRITRDDGLYHSHFELPSAQTYRYFAVEHERADRVRSAALVLGAKVTPANYYSPGWEIGRRGSRGYRCRPLWCGRRDPGPDHADAQLPAGVDVGGDFETKFRPLVERSASGGRRCGASIRRRTFIGRRGPISAGSGTPSSPRMSPTPAMGRDSRRIWRYCRWCEPGVRVRRRETVIGSAAEWTALAAVTLALSAFGAGSWRALDGVLPASSEVSRPAAPRPISSPARTPSLPSSSQTPPSPASAAGPAPDRSPAAQQPPSRDARAR